MKKNMLEPKIKRLRLGEIKLATFNPRIISQEPLPGLAASIARFGCVEPIVVKKKRGSKGLPY
jgi:ParB-like chromosome segregation protein Spo0J